jgi:hypothetical protein
MSLHKLQARQDKKRTTPGSNAVGKAANPITDNRPDSLLQKKQTGALKNYQPAKTLQKKVNNTGLPDNLRSGIEDLSGHSMADVKVHYNSDKPAQLSAHAFAQGSDIHLAAGQEKHLPHEAWHVVQQKQGRVKPTLQMKGININDSSILEKEADIMGAKAFAKQGEITPVKNEGSKAFSARSPAQRKVIVHEFQTKSLKKSWASIEELLMQNDFYKWAVKSTEVDLVIRDGGKRTEESADAYGTTGISLLTQPISMGSVLKNADKLAGLLNKTRSEAKKKPLFTIVVDIFPGELRNVEKDSPMSKLSMEDREYIALAHEIGVHAFPRLVATYFMLQKGKSTALDFLKLARSIEEEHGDVYPRGSKGKEEAKNKTYQILVGARMGDKGNDPLYKAFLGDIIRYEEHESPFALQLLETQISKHELPIKLRNAAIKGFTGLLAIIIFILLIYYMFFKK